MQEQVFVAVDIPLVGDERHKNWAKVVENVDTSRSTGWAFDGPFVAAANAAGSALRRLPRTKPGPLT